MLIPKLTYETLSMEFKEHEVQLKLLSFFFSKNPNNSVIINRRGIITETNENWIQYGLINGIDDVHKIGEGINYLGVCEKAVAEKSPFAREAYELIKGLTENKMNFGELEYSCHGPGNASWFLMQAFRLKNGHVAIVHYEITEKKILELKLREENKSLKQSNKDLEVFAYRASHDLKSPLRTIAGILFFIKRENAENLGKETLELIDSGQKAITDLSELIDTLLDLSRMLNIEDTQEVLSVESAVRQVISNIKPFLNQRKGQVQIVGDLPKIVVNPLKIRLVFQNLIQNGIKYNKNDSPTIWIDYEEREEHTFIVSDNGIGVPEEIRTSIFDLFFRKEEKEEGVGLGLATCKRLIESIGGRIWVEPRQSSGSNFFFTVPKK